MNVEKGVWFCYACGAKGTIESTTAPDSEHLLRMLTPNPIRVYPETWLDLFDAAYCSPYWSDRFGEKTARRFRCGTHPMTGNPTYPIRSLTGNVLGVVERTESTPKYRYPAGVPVSKSLFAYQVRPAEVMVLVEGAGDVMALDADGLGLQVGVLVVGCFGAGVHAPQVEAIRQLAPRLVIAAFDDDDAGRTAIRNAHTSLTSLTRVVSYRWGMLDGIGNTSPKDPGEAQHPGQRLGEFITQQEGMQRWTSKYIHSRHSSK